MTNAQNCPWRKSSYSDTGGNCVEVTHAGTTIAVRDSKNPGDGHLTFSSQAWTTFIDRINE